VCVYSFKTSKNDHIIEVQLYDDIDFICPYYPAELSSSNPEYYTIYMVGICLCYTTHAHLHIGLLVVTSVLSVTGSYYCFNDTLTFEITFNNYFKTIKLKALYTLGSGSRLTQAKLMVKQPNIVIHCPL